MGLFNSFKEVFTKPGKANIGQFAQTLGTLAAVPLGVAAYGAAKVGKISAVPTFDKSGKQIGSAAPTFKDYFGAGAESIAKGTASVFTASAKGIAQVPGAIASGGSRVLSAVVQSPKTVAEFVGQVLPQLLIKAPSQVAGAVQNIGSGSSRWFDMLNGRAPGAAPTETSINVSGPGAGAAGGEASKDALQEPVQAGIGGGLQIFLFAGLLLGMLVFTGKSVKR